MSVKDKITDFIGAAANEKPVAAYNAFASAVEDKVQGLLAQKQDEIRSKMFATEETLDEDTEQLDEDFGAMVMAVVAGNFLYEAIGILLAVLFAGGTIGFKKIKRMYEAYKIIKADRAAAKELEEFVKNSRVMKKVQASRGTLNDLRKNKKVNLKGLRGNARKEKEAELEQEIKNLFSEWQKYRDELRKEIENADLSDKTYRLLRDQVEYL